MKLEEFFDAVVMLTWSDWHSEPRSNRFHYATRFARNIPVLFLQHCYSPRQNLQIEPSGFDNIDLVHVNYGMTINDVLEFRRLLAARGIRRPLLWIYDSLNYNVLIDALPRAYRVYHATEDYLTYANVAKTSVEPLVESIKCLLDKVDFVVSCSAGVSDAYVNIGGYKGPHAVIENGCDADFFLSFIKEATPPSLNEKPIAVFQGGINERLDYPLLVDVVRRMPDWEFQFCGKSKDSEGWNRLLAEPNVNYLGELLPDAFAKVICNASVGIIPFIQDEWIRNSLPLKAYEYVSCGLPVVSIPIDALERDLECFEIASDAENFEYKLRESIKQRHNSNRIAKCREVARKNSYDNRFGQMLECLFLAFRKKNVEKKKLRVAILYDAVFSMHVQTIAEHIGAFDKYSRHDITYIPATPAYWNRPSTEIASMLDFSIFDVIVIHYSTRLSVLGHLEEGIASALERFTGLKILYIQDEYEGTEIARSWMGRLAFDIVYTCVPVSGISHVYPEYRFPATEFLPTLTGYVPEASNLESYAIPLQDRKVFIAYRGRKLPEIYGDLGQEKYTIGIEIKARSALSGIPVDIEVDDSKRIYGDDWYRFMGAARATLGTESGSNIFDFDGSIKFQVDRLKKENPTVSYAEIKNTVLAPHEGLVHMNQISPKVFEAIRLRTALILFEGEYSGVVRPNEHFIPLKKDYSNLDEVFKKLADDKYIEEITSRAYEEVVHSGKYSYRAFIQGFDADVESRIFHPNKLKLINGPLLFIDVDGRLKQALPEVPVGLISGHHPQGGPRNINEIKEALSGCERDIELPSKAYALLRRAGRLVPLMLRSNIRKFIRGALVYLGNSRERFPLLFRIARFVWRKLPEGLRVRLSRRVGY